MQPAPGDTSVDMVPKYSATVLSEIGRRENGSCPPASSRQQAAVAAAHEFRKVEAAGAGLIPKQGPTSSGETLSICT